MTARIQNNGLANLTGAWAAYATVPKWIQWGTGTGAAASANAVTTTGTGEARTNGTVSQQTTTVTNDTFQVTGTITATNTRAITEVGVFTTQGTGGPPPVSDLGNMCIYGDFSTINLASNDLIAFTIKVQFS